jgi:hypothetical protein
VARYDDSTASFEASCDLDIFKCLDRCMSPRGVRVLSNMEYKVAFLYILTNTPEMDSFFMYVLSQTRQCCHVDVFLLSRHNKDFVDVDTLTMNNGGVI